MKKIILIGAGGHAKSCIDVIELTKEYEIFGLIDSTEPHRLDIDGYNIIGDDNDLITIRKNVDHALIAIGQIESPKNRIKLYNLLKKYDYKLPSIRSPRSYISSKSKIGEGTIIMHDVIVNSGSTIGNNCIINNKSLIEHDVTVGNNCHLSTGSIINGNCIVGDNSFIGSGSIIVNDQKILPNSFIKAGTRFYKKNYD
tara:strand:+ start:377 stop:970 length:594 start_codon:yes stop_codon:yes gene_type:complete